MARIRGDLAECMISEGISDDGRHFVESVGNGLVTMHLLFDRERDRVVLIDGGLGRGFIPKIQDRLKRQGLTMKEVEAILLTH